MTKPPFLQAGDLIAIVATARKITTDEVAPAKTWLETQGYQVRLGSSIGLADRQFAGSDAERRADLQAQLNDPAVKAILCARGGYGTVRLVDALDWTAFRAQPKWLCGYSDITVLHAELQQMGFASIHSTMPLNFDQTVESTQSWESLHQVLQGKQPAYALQSLQFRRGSKMQGEVLGGNLSVLYSLMGSSSLPSTAGKILFLEDLDEYLYHLDRMMMCLKRGGLLDDLAGLLVGGLTKMNDNAIGFGKTAEEIIFEAVEDYDYPVAFGFPAGHQPLNQALVFGRQLQL
jgi:muramoyltetrapeptide carboxypeptidase